jgi:nucleotide-binding universal stress UspA family protein
MRCIVVATDGSEIADRALDFAADLARMTGAELVVTHVISAATATLAGPRPVFPAADLRVPTTVANAPLPEVLADDASDILARAKARAEAKGAPRVAIESRAGEPAEIVVAVAGERKADAIVLGKRGRGRLAGMLLGSVSQRVTMAARCAVIVVP